MNLHESVSQEEINRITRDSDVLISIGNKDSDFLPSKTLVYMGTGKPIIHFYGDEHDTSLEYLRKYPRALLVNLEDDIEENAKKIVHFLSEPTDEICNPALLLNLFYENTSAYTAEKMYSFIDGDIQLINNSDKGSGNTLQLSSQATEKNQKSTVSELY